MATMTMRVSIYVVVASLLAVWVGCTAANPAAAQQIYLTVAYCPTPFTDGGAIVSVDPVSGKFNIVGKFSTFAVCGGGGASQIRRLMPRRIAWPSEVFGCTLDYDPTVTFDHDSRELFMDFTEDEGDIVILDLAAAKIKKVVHSRDDFFTGYYNMVYSPKFLASQVKGTLTQRNGHVVRLVSGSRGTCVPACSAVNG